MNNLSRHSGMLLSRNPVSFVCALSRWIPARRTLGWQIF